MATYFSDTLAAANGTAVNGRVPDTAGTSWSGASWTIDSNRAHLNVTGEAQVQADDAPGGTGYRTRSKFRVVSITGTDTLWWGLLSHSQASPERHLRAVLEVASSALVVKVMFYNAAGGSGQRGSTVTGAGFSAGNDYGLVFDVTVSGAVFACDAYVTRDSDSNYLKPDGSWQASAVACVSTTHDDAAFSGVPLPTTGRGALRAFDFGGSGAGLHFYNFAVEDIAAGGGLSIPVAMNQYRQRRA